jgi:hypothetical protein
MRELMCAPLSESLSKMTGVLLDSMGGAERAQALASETVLAKSYGGLYCDAVRPAVEQLEHK